MKSYKELIETALQPVGKTMYIYGGGWNEEDTGSGIDSMRIGINKDWVKYFEMQGKDYDYRKTRYMYGKGLDCSGYIGWIVYNLFPNENGYVVKAKNMAKYFSEIGFGEYKEKPTDYKLGDIMSSNEHVYMVIGECIDGSIILVHSSPCGVQINGTVTPKNSRKSKAIAIAEKYMKEKYPKWYEKYPKCDRGIDYLKNFRQMRWKILDDKEHYTKKEAVEILWKH